MSYLKKSQQALEGLGEGGIMFVETYYRHLNIDGIYVVIIGFLRRGETGREDE